ncbi:MAG: porin [Rubrivivax sp.]|nr:porin [Rubrivivax sp.]
MPGLRQLTIALAACGIAWPAAAQGITLFGLLDAGIEVLDNVGPGGSRLVRMPSLTGTVSSRLGVRMQEDLGGGLSAQAVLEMGLAPDQGTMLQGGRAWGRQSWVGLQTPLGLFSAGRQYTMLFWSVLEADILGPNLFGTGSLDAGIPNARSDNTLAWRHGFSGWTLGATWSLGRDVANAGPSPSGTNCAGESATDSRACRAWSAMVKLDRPRWGFAIADDRQHGREVGPAPDAVFGGLDSSAKVDRRLSVNGYLKWGEVKLGGGVIDRRNDGDAVKPDRRLWYFGAAWPVMPQLTIDGAWMTLRHANVDGHDATLVALRGLYSFSRRTAVYAQLGRISNERLSALSVSAGAAGSNPAPGQAQNAVNAGLRHSF